MSYYDEECPHCGKDIDVGSIWSLNDPTTQFSFECPHCDKAVHCEVEFDPSFSLSKNECSKCGQLLIEDKPYCDSCLETIRGEQAGKGRTS